MAETVVSTVPAPAVVVSSATAPTSVTVGPAIAGPRGTDAKLAMLFLQLTVAGWADNAQTVAATGVTASNFVVLSPAPASQAAYVDAGIICTEQGADSLTFTCETTPTGAITVNVGVIG